MDSRSGNVSIFLATATDVLGATLKNLTYLLCKIMYYILLLTELSQFSYMVKYRPGIENIAADTLTRAGRCATILSDTEIIASTSTVDLQKLHNSLIHPGIKRMLHFVKVRNLPFSVEDIRRVVSSCTVCSKIKPQFYKSEDSKLIKATNPFERLSIDFKGVLPRSAKGNIYILTIIDEFSRFPFAYPCKDTSTTTVIKCLTNLFSIFGLPSYIHSDRGASFMSIELKNFLTSHGVATSRSTPYHPLGNSQCERYNGIIWNTIKLALESKNLDINCWESVLPDSLHAIRSLLCTSTNERMFNYSRKTSTGCTIPTWLSTPGTVLLRRHVRQSKFEPLVQPVELLEANPDYAHVRFPEGREDTVSIRDLAPYANPIERPDELTQNFPIPQSPTSPAVPNFPLTPETETTQAPENVILSPERNQVEIPNIPPTRNKSTRIRKPLDRLNL